MKKKLLYVLSLGVFLFSMTGCVKFNANMDIKNDKSMDYSIIYAIDTSVFGEEMNFSDEDKANLEKQGFSVNDYTEGSMKGFTLSKKIKNIDSVSTENENEYSLSGVLEESSNNYMFKVKKGFFKNTYSAKFDFNASDSGLTNSGENNFDNPTEEDEYEWETDLNNEDAIIEDSNDDWSLTDEEGNDFDLSGLTNSMSNMDLSFNVKLPYSALSNNASNAENDNKNLSWNLSSESAETIEFEFELYNITNICIVAGAALILIIIIIVIIISSKKKGKKVPESSNNVQEPIAPITSISSIDEPAETIMPDINEPENVGMNNMNQQFGQPIQPNMNQQFGQPIQPNMNQQFNQPIQPNINQQFNQQTIPNQMNNFETQPIQQNMNQQFDQSIQPNMIQQNDIEPVNITEPVENLDINAGNPQIQPSNSPQQNQMENTQPTFVNTNQPNVNQPVFTQPTDNAGQQLNTNLANDMFGQQINNTQNQNNN